MTVTGVWQLAVSELIRWGLVTIRVIASWQVVFVSCMVLSGSQDGCKVTAGEDGSGQRTQIQNGGQVAKLLLLSANLWDQVRRQGFPAKAAFTCYSLRPAWTTYPDSHLKKKIKRYILAHSFSKAVHQGGRVWQNCSLIVTMQKREIRGGGDSHYYLQGPTYTNLKLPRRLSLSVSAPSQ
jgi:hypothetical protein